MQLYQNPGWGSAIVEAQLALLGQPCNLIEAGDIYADPAARAALARVNPLIQIPTLVLPTGQVMTESAAITLHLADLTGSALLVPPPGDPDRADFLRWLIFIVANIYPCFTFADVPTRFVTEAEGAAYKARVTDHATRLWQVLDAFAASRGGPWVLGPRFSALDVFVAVMVNWRPGKQVLSEKAPTLAAIAARAAARPDLSAVMARNFP